MDDHPEKRGALLAVDVGLRTGLAMYGRDGRLQWYRSQHFADPGALRRAVRRLLAEHAELILICLEGGGRLGEIWEKEAMTRGVRVRHVAAETWRSLILYERDQRHGRQAKNTADEVARRVIEWSAARRPTSLRHDASEAILIGLWCLLDAGWLKRLPCGIRG